MTKEREELLDLIARISEVAPELRLGQLITNLSLLARGAVVEGIWDAEDEELIQAARRIAEGYERRHSEEVASEPAVTPA